MATVLAFPASPAPYSFPATAAALSRPRTRTLTVEQREALADLASIARSVRFDVSKGNSRTEGYAQEIGRQVIELVQLYSKLEARDWDRVIDELG